MLGSSSAEASLLWMLLDELAKKASSKFFNEFDSIGFSDRLCLLFTESDNLPVFNGLCLRFKESGSKVTLSVSLFLLSFSFS